MRVLVIEDDRKAAQLLAKGLREERFVVDLAHSAEIGDELASVNDYDVIILDWLLPDGDGIEYAGGSGPATSPLPSSCSPPGTLSRTA